MHTIPLLTGMYHGPKHTIPECLATIAAWIFFKTLKLLQREVPKYRDQNV